MNNHGRVHGIDPANPYPQYLRTRLLPSTPSSGNSRNKWYRLAFIKSTSLNSVSSWYFAELEVFSGQNSSQACYGKMILRLLYEPSGRSSALFSYDEADFIGITVDNFKIIQTSEQELNRIYEIWYRSPVSWQSVSVRVNFEHFYQAGIVFDGQTERPSEPEDHLPMTVTIRNRSGIIRASSVNQLPAPSESLRGKLALVENQDGIRESFSLYIHGIAKQNGQIHIKLDEVTYTIPLTTADNTWLAVHNKIRSLPYAGWTLTPGNNVTTIIFTADQPGPRNVKVDMGNTGVTYTLTPLTKGMEPSGDIIYVCKKMLDQSYRWVPVG